MIIIIFFLLLFLYLIPVFFVSECRQSTQPCWACNLNLYRSRSRLTGGEGRTDHLARRCENRHWPPLLSEQIYASTIWPRGSHVSPHKINRQRKTKRETCILLYLCSQLEVLKDCSYKRNIWVTVRRLFECYFCALTGVMLRNELVYSLSIAVNTEMLIF